MEVVIEAVFEDPSLKHKVFAEIEDVVSPDALLCSNTSTLPITVLAEGVKRQNDFVGLHFFSPVDKMPLVEVIKGANTSDEAVTRALGVVQQLRKTPIVVNDSRGFFTSRVIGTFTNEGIAMLAEGIPAATIEQASSQAGYPAPVLQLMDELTLTLPRKVRNETKAAVVNAGGTWTPSPAEAVIDRMIDEFGRPGRSGGKGFYEYENGRRTRLWPGLSAFGTGLDPTTIDVGKGVLLVAELIRHLIGAELHGVGIIPFTRQERDFLFQRASIEAAQVGFNRDIVDAVTVAFFDVKGQVEAFLVFG